MSRNLDDKANCDVCCRTRTLWELMSVIPEDDTLPDFLMCLWCARSVNTVHAYLESRCVLPATIEWLLEGRTDSMPSSNLYHPSRPGVAE